MAKRKRAYHGRRHYHLKHKRKATHKVHRKATGKKRVIRHKSTKPRAKRAAAKRATKPRHRVAHKKTTRKTVRRRASLKSKVHATRRQLRHVRTHRFKHHHTIRPHRIRHHSILRRKRWLSKKLNGRQ